jgi:hypothetical protein
MRPDDKWEAKSRTTQARCRSHDYGREKLQGLVILLGGEKIGCYFHTFLGEDV